MVGKFSGVACQNSPQMFGPASVFASTPQALPQIVHPRSLLRHFWILWLPVCHSKEFDTKPIGRTRLIHSLRSSFEPPANEAPSVIGGTNSHG